jgi:tetratricopeptide (TPR) repeat protein
MKKVLKFVLPIVVIFGLIFLSYIAYIALKPKEVVPVNYISIGDTLLEQSSYSLALEQYKKGINQDPKSELGYIKASNIYLLKNDTEQSLKILLEGVKNTESEDIYFELVKVYTSLKRIKNLL